MKLVRWMALEHSRPQSPRSYWPAAGMRRELWPGSTLEVRD